MKKRKIIFLLLCNVLIMLTGCSKKNSNDNNSNDFLTQYTYDYTIKQENDDGTTEISVIAPDFETIIENMTIDILEDENPDYKKEYAIIVSDLSDKEEVEAVLNNRIAEELIKSAIINIEYKEEWSTEE